MADVFEGTPTMITSFFVIASKLGIITALIRIVAAVFSKSSLGFGNRQITYFFSFLGVLIADVSYVKGSNSQNAYNFVRMCLLYESSLRRMFRIFALKTGIHLTMIRS